jgi:hypothetical protein
MRDKEIEMKNINIKTVILAISSTLILTACGGGGGGSTPSGDSAPQSSNVNEVGGGSVPSGGGTPQSSNVNGTVVDGPIYDANVSFYDLNGTLLGSTITSNENGKLGEYNITIQNLPEQYIVKVTGGRDSGADGIKNENDEESFPMSSVGSKGDKEVHVSPATTLITKMVEDGVEFTKANKNVQIALGLPADTNLTTTNPKTNDIASRAGTFIAGVLKIIPTDDRDVAFESIGDEIKKKADANKSVATINSVSVSIDDLNLSAIANDVKTKKVDAIKDEDIEKLESTKDIFENQIKKTTQKIKAFDNLSDDERKEALASSKTLLSLKDEVEQIDKEELDRDTLEHLSVKLEDGFKKVLEDGLDKLSNDNIDILSDVIEKNLDKNISFMGDDLKTIANQTKELDSEIKTVVKKLYSAIDLNESKKMQNLKTDDIKDLVASIDENDTATKELLEESIASKLTTLVRTSTTIITTQKITEVKTQTVDNNTLKSRLKTIATTTKTLEEKTTLTSEEKAELKAQELALKNINKNLEDEDFRFDETAQKAIDDLTKKIESEMKVVFEDESKTEEELFDEINSMKITITLIKIDVEFDADNYQDTLGEVKKITDNLRVQKESNIDMDLKSSYEMVEKELEEAFENNQSISDSATQINNDMEKYILEKEQEVVQVSPPTFPKIGGFKMPVLLDSTGGEIIK